MQKYIQWERKNKVIRGGKHRKITWSVGQEVFLEKWCLCVAQIVNKMKRSRRIRQKLTV